MKENNSLLNNLKKDIQKILIFLNNNQNENKENINIKSKEELNNDKKKSNNLLTQNNQLKEDLNNDKEKSFNLFSLKNQGLEIGKYSSLKYESFNNDLNEQKTKSHEIQKNHENLISLLNNNLNENTHPHSNNINDYNDEDIAKSKRKSQKFLGIRNLIFEQDKKIDQELFREYVTIKKII
jgi:chromosome segregation protein